MIGEYVTHMHFGEGTLSAFAPTYIEMAFRDGTV